MMTTEQRELCSKYGVAPLESPANLKVGIAENVKTGSMPINGLRHPPEEDTTGWYVWGGEELSHDEGFFKPLHVRHLEDWSPLIAKFLALPPGWRFLTDGEYEDVWFDPALLDV